MSWRVIVGDCVEVMRAELADSVDAIVTDPPYGLEFMGKEWDGANGFRRTLNPADVKRESVFGRTSKRSPEYRAGRLFQEFSLAWATEALRVLKPGAHLLAFGGTRTYHRLVCALEDAGFEIRDTLAWMYGSGFPKSLDVSKAIDKAAGAEREVVGLRETPWVVQNEGPAAIAIGEQGERRSVEITAPATPAAQQWQGWGTALKPSWESIVLARKPLSEKTVAANVQRWGTGALNIDGTRIGAAESKRAAGTRTYAAGKLAGGMNGEGELQAAPHDGLGRWPANLILDETAAALLDEQSGDIPTTRIEKPSAVREEAVTWGTIGLNRGARGYTDNGGASRFFYTAKASRRERTGYSGPNNHPTVKPVALMRWLVKLITPPERSCGGCCDEGTENQEQCCRSGHHHQDCAGGCNGTSTVAGVVLDPFMGTGTTGIAAVSEGFGFVGIDQDAGYVSLAERRIHNEAGLFSVQEEVTTQEPTR